MKLSPNTKFITVLLVVLMLLTVSCNPENDESAKAHIDHFSYDSSALDGPDSWHHYRTSKNTENQCRSTKRQSPINITNTIVDSGLEMLITNYSTATTEVINNGHTIQFNYNAQAELVFNNVVYSLKQFHFHTKSEHAVNDHFSPLELHLVHENDFGDLAVIGVFFELGEENSFLNQFINSFPLLKGQKYFDSKTYNALELLPSNKNYYTYSGSLTTPPCSEVVTWIVMETPLEISQKQLDVFSSILIKNNRPIQPLGNREVYAFVAH